MHIKLIALCALMVFCNTRKVWAATVDGCLSPSLPRGRALDIVIAGYEANTNVSYLFDLGLTNSRVLVYRRVEANVPLRSWTGPCGVSVEERLLLPNHGRDAAAFYDYMVENYDMFPGAIVFLHGHGPFGDYRTESRNVLGRISSYYQSLALREPISQHMVNLNTPKRKGKVNRFDDFHGRKAFDPFHGASDPLCYVILDKYHVVSDTDFTGGCCATFILPSEKAVYYPRALYEELGTYVRETSYDDSQTARHCFEFIIVRIFHERPIESQPEVLEWYERVDTMLGGIVQQE